MVVLKKAYVKPMETTITGGDASRGSSDPGFKCKGTCRRGGVDYDPDLGTGFKCKATCRRGGSDYEPGNLSEKGVSALYAESIENTQE